MGIAEDIGHKRPPTQKQYNLIRFIYYQLKISFKGTTIKEAYEFIGKYKNDAQARLDKEDAEGQGDEHF